MVLCLNTLERLEDLEKLTAVAQWSIQLSMQLLVPGSIPTLSSGFNTYQPKKKIRKFLLIFC